MKIAFLGTGFVADYYALTLANHPSLTLAAANDIDGERLAQFCAFHGVDARPLDAILGDDDIRLVVNLTTPDVHDVLNRQVLAAGKHVYCEKPLALDPAAGRETLAMARANGLSLAGAPANALSDAADLVARALADGLIGKPRLVMAEMDDGPVFRQDWQTWRSRSGARWPGVHEFETGCTLEHAGYALSWMIRLFGPVRSVASLAGTAHPDKGPGANGPDIAHDFSFGTLAFDNGVAARLTNGLAAPRDRSMTIVGEQGTLIVDDLWDNRSVVRHIDWDAKPPLAYRVARRLEAKFGRVLPIEHLAGRKLAYPETVVARHLPSYPSQIDFARGIVAQARRIEAGDLSLDAGEVALHIAEVSAALHDGCGPTVPVTLAPAAAPAKRQVRDAA